MQNKPKFIALRRFLGQRYDELHATLLVRGYIRDIQQSDGLHTNILFRGKFTCSEVLSSHRFPLVVQYYAIAAAIEEMDLQGIERSKHGITSDCTKCQRCIDERKLLENLA
ncbi:hypothetical protein PhaR5_090 [Acinetobacter phage PhaR5]|nr:hypothetical protein PhaR5_090 [Acinetobacter phage PhaR5]UQS93618.1 hypothetical protein AC4_038 [Acinetobacter phage AC4]